MNTPGSLSFNIISIHSKASVPVRTLAAAVSHQKREASNNKPSLSGSNPLEEGASKAAGVD